MAVVGAVCWGRGQELAEGFVADAVGGDDAQAGDEDGAEGWQRGLSGTNFAE